MLGIWLVEPNNTTWPFDVEKRGKTKLKLFNELVRHIPLWEWRAVLNSLNCTALLRYIGKRWRVSKQWALVPHTIICTCMCVCVCVKTIASGNSSPYKSNSFNNCQPDEAHYHKQASLKLPEKRVGWAAWNAVRIQIDGNINW